MHVCDFSKKTVDYFASKVNILNSKHNLELHLMNFFKYIIFSILIFTQTVPVFCADTKVESPTKEEKSLSAAELEHIVYQEKIDKSAINSAKKIKKILDTTISEVQKVSPQTADVLKKEFFGIATIQFVALTITLLLMLILARFLLKPTFDFLHNRAKKSGGESFASTFLDRLRMPIYMFVWTLGVYFALVFLLKDTTSITMTSRAVGILFWGAVFWTALLLCDAFFVTAARKFKKKSSSSTANLLQFLNRVVKFFIVVIAVLSLLTNCGVNVNTIIASLGIGGMALAFASQDTIANFFGSVSIILDRPFIIGDWVKTNACEGNVEAIGFRSTRIRTFEKTLVTIPNSILAKEAIENLSKMPVRRVKQTIGLTYSSTAEQIENLLPELRDRILATEGVHKKSDVIVEFLDFDASALNITITYYTINTDYTNHTATKRRVNFVIMRTIESLNLSFAFPSMSVYMEQNAPQKH